MEIGKTIADLRESRGMSQETLARQLFVSRDLVSKWENGTRRPDWPTIERIARVFDVPPDRILRRDEYVFDELADCLPSGADVSEEELVPLLNAFLKGLHRRAADLFVLRYHLLKSPAQIASACGIRENHVRSSLSKTRKQLKQYLEEQKNER
ncbi:MAG: helix-turn-helix domain-containing protein [Clostridia bacterium]|nr:helix-turn-helix domain-containing protein [Clostridia bacterium]